MEIFVEIEVCIFGNYSVVVIDLKDCEVIVLIDIIEDCLLCDIEVEIIFLDVDLMDCN